MMMTDLPLPGKRAGKVRDTYPCTTHGRDALLLVATDRISAFDVIMPNGIPGKGVVLTAMSNFWFDMIRQHFGDRVQTHVISTDPADIDGLTDRDRDALVGRAVIGRRCRVVPIECVVRGYLAGSGWKEYQASQSVCGVSLPAGLRQCDKLPQPIFTPATKAETGHDENIDFESACAIAGDELMHTMRDLSIAIYQLGHDHAARHGIILADTKFEFGVPLESDDKSLMLIDEAMTPDSSRFWPSDEYEPGRDQVSFDKQYVRDFLQDLVDADRWNKEAPGPMLPEEVIANTLDKYLEAYRRLTGRDLPLKT